MIDEALFEQFPTAFLWVENGVNRLFHPFF
jgi:hypothetical protein